MRKYEMMYIVKPNLEEEARTEILNKVKSIIEADGTVDSVNEWGNRRLAYEIEKLNEGYYVLVNYTAAVDVPKEIERNLRISDKVLRYLTVKHEA